MNEACLNLLNTDISSAEGKQFARDVLDFMRDVIKRFQSETGNFYNLEATPAEGVSYRLARKDRSLFPEIRTAGQNEPYYTNSVHLGVSYSDDLFEVLDHQDDLQTRFTGGTVVHLFLGEKIDDIETVKKLVRRISENYELPYFSLTPTFSICPVHGYLSGEHRFCPHDHSAEELRKYGIEVDADQQ
jgi:ribonucleoside-triphosphate reductase